MSRNLARSIRQAHQGPPTSDYGDGSCSLAEATPMAYTKDVTTVPMTLVEMPEFIRRSKHLLSAEELNALQIYLATHPESGDILPGTGGVRKLRWALEGQGKSGGARVIYYFHNESIPIFLLTLFPKNKKVDLSKAEKNELKKLLPELVQSYQKRSVTWRKSKNR